MPRLALPVVGRGGVVPYVATWTSEQALTAGIIGRGRQGIGYVDETSVDRDRDGVLWIRMSLRPGHGRPLYNQMHPLRQRRAMKRLLCQVCAGPADQTSDGHLWLLTDHRQDWDGWPEGSANPFPPVCLACARLSTQLCPPLRRGFVAVRAHSEPHGVVGVQFQADYPLSGLRLAEDDGGIPVAYNDPVLPWTLATQLTRTLHGCALVDLDQLTDNVMPAGIR
ncbi:MAG TPA: hypothetical protein VFX16_21775 [Pseudonocardiaceae bacterium]|nr:hypothetical protein [Pseudonocardiaceae bacterium]